MQVKLCDDFCHDCAFRGDLNGYGTCCNFLLITGVMRPCPAGSGCTVKKRGRRLSAWNYEDAQKWNNSASKPIDLKNKKFWERTCQECGAQFYAYNPKQVFCSKKCNDRAQQRRYYAKKKQREGEINAKTLGK